MGKNTFLTLVILFYLSLFLACGISRRPSCYLFPDGYVGWVRVYYGVTGAPALPIEDGRYIIKLPSSGILATSSRLEEGWASDQYFYYSDNGRRPLIATMAGAGGLIWGDHVTSNGRTTYITFFVGPETEYKDHGVLDDDQVPGPLDKKGIEQKKKEKEKIQ